MASHLDANPRQPVVGVTGNAKWWSPSWICIRLAVWLAGCKAVRLSVRHHYPIDSVNAIVSSGGDDIHPSLYGQEAVPKGQYDPQRDALEQRHIAYAFEKKIPMLGICRGTQLINVSLGGSLHIDIRARRKNTSNRGTVLPRKTAALRANSRVAQITKASRLRINSLHYQAVKELGDGVRIVARDLDGFVQGIEPVDEARWIGVQWHPEYLFYRATHLRLFKWLVQQARQHRPPSPNGKA